MARASGSSDYSGAGYWAVQIGVSALLAVLGLGGGVFILIDSGNPDSASSTDAGAGAIVLLVGVVFLLLLVWLVVGFASQSRQRRAVYAWAIMQDYVARNPGSRPVRPGRAVRGDLVSLATAAQARDGRLSYEEVLRLQMLRPEVPYPGNLEALRRASEAPVRVPVRAEDRERLRTECAVDDAEAGARLGASGLGRRSAARTAAIATRAVGWGAIAAFLLSAVLGSAPPMISLFLALLALWCLLRLLTGILQDARNRKGRAVAETWRSDPERAARGLPAPFAEFFRAPLGAWWMRLLTPMMLLGVCFLIGGAANIARTADPVERGVFIGMACGAAALFLASIALRVLQAKRAETDRARLTEYRGARAMLEVEAS